MNKHQADIQRLLDSVNIPSYLWLKEQLGYALHTDTKFYFHKDLQFVEYLLDYSELVGYFPSINKLPEFAINIIKASPQHRLCHFTFNDQAEDVFCIYSYPDESYILQGKCENGKWQGEITMHHAIKYLFNFHRGMIMDHFRKTPPYDNMMLWSPNSRIIYQDGVKVINQTITQEGDGYHVYHQDADSRICFKTLLYQDGLYDPKHEDTLIFFKMIMYEHYDNYIPSSFERYYGITSLPGCKSITILVPSEHIISEVLNINHDHYITVYYSRNGFVYDIHTEDYSVYQQLYDYYYSYQ